MMKPNITYQGPYPINPVQNLITTILSSLCESLLETLSEPLDVNRPQAHLIGGNTTSLLYLLHAMPSSSSSAVWLLV